MPAEPWAEVERLFEQALERPPAERDAWLRAQCRGDRTMAAEVASLLAADAEIASVTGEDERILAEVGTRVVEGERGRYRIEARLGTGGTSTVYLASRLAGEGSDAPANAEPVAVKVLRGDGGSALAERFALEAQVLRHLDHPAIARFVDSGLTGRGRPFVVTAYVEGEPIDRYCARLGLPLAARLELFVAICDAVHEAHRNLIIHRDLKPGNVLVGASGEPVLLDFGLARQLTVGPGPGPGPGAGAEPTATAARMLTPFAASPEQIRGEPLTTATDVWSLGVLLHQLLAGSAPFDAWTGRPELLAHAICERDPPPPSRAARDAGQAVRRTDDGEARGGSGRAEASRWWRQLRGDLDAIVGRALRKRAAHRYASAEQLADDVRRHLDGRPVRARRAGVLYRFGKTVRRHRWAVVATATVAAAVLLAAVTALAHERRMARERDRTERSFAFLVDLLGAVEPGQGGGDRVTAREILDRGRQRIDAELGDQPDLAARMLDAVGTVYMALGEVDDAESCLVRALALRRELADGRASADLAESVHNLGVLRSEQTRHAESEALLREAVALRIRLAGEASLPVATSLARLADALRDQAKYQEAERLFRRAELLLRRHLGDRHEAVAEVLNGHGLLLHDRGDGAGAETLYRRALAIQERRFAGDHPARASTMQNIATVLRMQGRLDESAVLFEAALGMSERLYGAVSGDVAVTVQNLGLLHLDRQDLESAAAAFSRAIAIDRTIHGEEHSNIATNVYHLGLVALRGGDWTTAETRFRDAVRRYEQTLGPEHPWLGFPLIGLASSLVELCRPAEAVPSLDRAIAIRTAALGAEHWRVADAESVRGHALVLLGHRDEGLRLLDRSVTVLAAALPADHGRRIEAGTRQEEAAAGTLPTACTRSDPGELRAR